MCMFVCVVHVSMCVHMCVQYVCVHIYVVYVHTCICVVYVHICMCVCICVYTCVARRGYVGSQNENWILWKAISALNC